MKIKSVSKLTGFIQEVEQTLDRAKCFKYLKTQHEHFYTYSSYTPIKNNEPMLLLKDDEENFVVLNLIAAAGDLDEKLYEHLRIDA